jgi:hypothetical protein
MVFGRCWWRCKLWHCWTVWVPLHVWLKTIDASDWLPRTCLLGSLIFSVKFCNALMIMNISLLCSLPLPVEEEVFDSMWWELLRVRLWTTYQGNKQGGVYSSRLGIYLIGIPLFLYLDLLFRVSTRVTAVPVNSWSVELSWWYWLLPCLWSARSCYHVLHFGALSARTIQGIQVDAVYRVYRVSHQSKCATASLPLTLGPLWESKASVWGCTLESGILSSWCNNGAGRSAQFGFGDATSKLSCWYDHYIASGTLLCFVRTPRSFQAAKEMYRLPPSPAVNIWWLSCGKY